MPGQGERGWGPPVDLDFEPSVEMLLHLGIGVNVLNLNLEPNLF